MIEKIREVLKKLEDGEITAYDAAEWVTDLGIIWMEELDG